MLNSISREGCRHWPTCYLSCRWQFSGRRLSMQMLSGVAGHTMLDPCRCLPPCSCRQTSPLFRDWKFFAFMTSATVLVSLVYLAGTSGLPTACIYQARACDLTWTDAWLAAWQFCFSSALGILQMAGLSGSSPHCCVQYASSAYSTTRALASPLPS